MSGKRVALARRAAEWLTHLEDHWPEEATWAFAYELAEEDARLAPLPATDRQESLFGSPR